MSVCHIIAILLSAQSCLGSHFRGGIITWTPTEQESQIEVSYRVSWRRSSGSSHFCDDTHVSSGLMLSGEGSLECSGGCTVTSTPMGYYCTDFSLSEDWTTGTRTLLYNLTTSATKILFTYTSCCWIPLLVGGNGGWAVKATASVAKRADTGKINSSPKTSVSPIVRVIGGCNATINLLVADPDGDIVRCRWANASDECGIICSSFPGAVLNKDTCTISFQTTGSDGYYGVAVQAEDFPATGGTVPYSSVPVQFLVYVYSTSQGCFSLPEFISPTRGDQEVVYIAVNNIYFDKIVAISNVPNTSIDEITTVSPSGFIKSALAKYPDVPGAWYVNITWTPSASDVNKLHILCFTATDEKRLTSQQRCINLIVTPDVTNNGSDRIDFDYGLTNDDSLIGVNDGKCKLVSKEYEFPVFRSTYSKIFVCVTGIITFDEPFESPGTVDGSDLKGRTILAPYFNDIDMDSLRHGGNVYYHVYNSVKGDINKSSNVRTAQEIIQQIHGDVGNFIAQFALFVTWHQVRPLRTKTGQNEYKYEQVLRSWLATATPIRFILYSNIQSGRELPGPKFCNLIHVHFYAVDVSYDCTITVQSKICKNRMNFQLALLTDGVNTFAFYVYPKNGMKLKSQLVYIGFTTKDGEKYVDYRSFTSAVLNIDVLAISFGYTGLLHYRLSFPSLGQKSSRQGCIDWYLNERKYKDEYQEGLKKMPLCPCDTSHLARDQFYSDNEYIDQGDSFCTYIRPNWQFRPKDSGKTCCYDKKHRYFVGYGSTSGGFVRYHPNKQALKHKSYDKDMRTACCEENDLCSLYHSVRPVGQCYTIFPAWHAPARGDPHFKTLDGQNYTFNGWGEFTLVTINSSTEGFELQARTARVVREDGNLSDATAFSAFAAKDTNDVQIHVELNAAKDGLIVYAKMEPGLMLSDYTSDYTNMDKEFKFESDYMSLSRRNQTKNVVAVFASGVAFTVGISVNMLNIDVLIPNKFQNMTAGLLGNFDGDPTNDIQFKNGTILWGIVGEKDIFNFGKSWAVDPDHSAFWYPQGKGYYDYSHLNYTPIFLEDLDTAKVASARGVCGEEEYECIFDLVLTEDEGVANETRRLGYVARQVDALLENKAPSISGPSTINVTINNTMTYHLSAFDDGSFSYLLLDGQMYANITDQKNGTAVVTLLLQDDRPINVKATVVDEFGAQATPHQLDIVVCSTCNQRGTCDFAEFRDDNRTTDSFKYATCLCDPYWDGPDCEMDRDGCATQPCSPLRKCTDIPADLHQVSGVGYNCTDCPDGFTSLNDGRCEDIDECSSSNGGCSQICNNTYGTFSCSCFEGYRKQTGVCQDINECSEASNDCDQICSNSIGGYNCSCYEGFVFNSVKKSCEKGVLPSGCNSLNCSGTAGCTTDTHGNATCFCPKGYQLSSDGETCNDINECLLPICQHRCTNTDGSFSCSCFNGYSIESDRSSCKECELSKYGENCNNTCKCGQGAIRCDRIKGCICSDGWTGTNCDEDLDECLVPNICNDSFKICLNTKGSYVCNCRDGYVLNTSRSCEDLDECNDPDLNTCQQVCKNEAGGFSCSCFFGYVQSRNSTSLCEDIDECTVGQSGCEQLCHNSEGRFTCDCHFGYILSHDRKTCLKVTDVCVTYGNINCSQICVLEDGQVFCSCVNGYKLSSDNQTCEDINECEDQELNRCSNNCTNHNFGYTCSCANGSQLDNDGRTCKACDAFHYGPNCSYSCNCGVGAERCDPITGCVCSDGWHGNKCDQDVNECAQNPCTDNNSLCFNTPGSYVCNCLLGYRNVSGVCQDIVECSDSRLNDCNHICLNNIGSYSCSCHEGFVSNGNVCSDIDECTGHHNCFQICVNTEGSYLCKCNKGFWLSESDLSTCIPCKANKYGQDCMYDCSCYMPNTQTCDSIDGTCICREGWESAECNIDIDECSNSSSCDAVNTICINRNGSYSCECRQGYVMDNDAQCKATSPITASATTPTTGSTLTPTTLTSMAEASTTSVTINGETTTTSGSTTSEVTSSTTTSTAENLVTTELKTSSPSLTPTIARTPSTSTPTTDVTLMPHTSISFTTADTTSDRTTISEGKSSQTTVTMTATMSKTSTTLLPATASPSLMTSNSQTSTLTPTAGATTTTSSGSSVIAVDTSKTTSSGGTTATSESTTAQTTTPAATTSSEITTTSALTSPSLMTSNSKTSTLTPIAAANTTTRSSSSLTTVDTSKTTSSGGITATSESITAQTTAPAMTTTSEITTSVITGSPFSTSSVNRTSTLTPTAGPTTTTRSGNSVTTVDTSKTAQTTSAATNSSEITTMSALTSPSLMTSNSKTSTLIPTVAATTTTSSSSSVTTIDTSKTTSSGGITATSESITAQTTAPAMTTTSEITTSVMTGSHFSTSSVNRTSTLTPTAGPTTTTRSSSSVTIVDTSKTAQTTSAATNSSEITTMSALTSPSLMTSNSKTSTFIPTAAATTTTSSSSSVTTVDTSKTTSSGGITATSESITAQTTAPAMTTTSEITTSVMTGSPSSTSSVNPTSTLTPTAGSTTTTRSSSSVTTVDTSKTSQTTTPAATNSSEITTMSALTSPSLMTSNSKTSTLTPTAGATTTTSSSSSLTTVDTSKTTSSGGITATSESITAQTTAPAMTTTSEITTSVMTGSPSSTSSANRTSTLTPTAGSTTTTRSSSSVTTVDTSKTTSIDVTTTKLKSSTAPTTAPAFTTTYEIPTTSVITTSASLTTSTSSARESTLTNGVTTTPATSMLTVTAATNNTTTTGATTVSKNSTSHTSMPTNTTTSQLYTSSTITSTSQIPTSSSSTSTPWASSSSPTSTVSGTSSPSTSAMTSSSNTTTSTKETTTSTSACTNNTFGMNCSLHCNCNISNSINKSQACDPKNGTCLCNEGWMGVNCSQDVNECEINPEICKEMNNSGCYNVYGSFKCQCHIGYISDGNRTCMEDVPKTTTPMTVNATDSKYKAIITLDLNLQASIDIKVPENYAKVERDVQDALSEFYRTKMNQLFVRVIIVSIRRGSLIVEYFTVTRGSDDALLKLGDANAKLAAGEKISVAGKDSSAVRLNVEGNDLPNDTSADQILCKSYQSLKGACNTDYECILIDNRPTCTPKKKEDNFVLIVAVGTGTSLFVLLLLVIVAVLCYKRKTRQWKTSKELIYRSDSISNRTNQTMATKWHTFDWMKHVSYGFDPSDMLGHSPHPNKQNCYQGNEEGNTENNLSRSLYGDEANSSASKKEFKIKRPKVYGVGNVSYDNGIYN